MQAVIIELSKIENLGFCSYSTKATLLKTKNGYTMREFFFFFANNSVKKIQVNNAFQEC